MASPKVYLTPKNLERLVSNNLRRDAGFSGEKFPKSLKRLVEAEKREYENHSQRLVLRTISLKESTERKLRLLAHHLACSKDALIRVILNFELLSKEELRKKYLTP